MNNLRIFGLVLISRSYVYTFDQIDQAFFIGEVKCSYNLIFRRVSVQWNWKKIPFWFLSRKTILYGM